MIFKIFGDMDTIFLILRALNLIDSQYAKGYRLTLLSLIFLILLGLAVLGGVIWLVWKDLKRKREKTGYETLIGKEAEVTKVSFSKKKGWVVYEGENWKFSSVDSLAVGDIVKIKSCKRMILQVEKAEDQNE